MRSMGLQNTPGTFCLPRFIVPKPGLWQTDIHSRGPVMDKHHYCCLHLLSESLQFLDMVSIDQVEPGPIEACSILTSILWLFRGSSQRCSVMRPLSRRGVAVPAIDFCHVRSQPLSKGPVTMSSTPMALSIWIIRTYGNLRYHLSLTLIVLLLLSNLSCGTTETTLDVVEVYPGVLCP